jgi:hypothetical protein
MKNIQSTILTAPDLCKNVPLAVLFDSNGNSYVVPTKSDMRVCVYILYIKRNVCLYVCTELTQIHISEPIWTKFCTRLPFGLEETVGHVWTQKFLPLRTFGPFLFEGHCRIMGTRWLSARPFSAIPLYPWFQLVFAWRHRHYVVADGGVIRGSLISVILAGVPLTFRKWRCSRRQPQRRIPYSGGCSRHVMDITFNRATGSSATALHLSF